VPYENFIILGMTTWYYKPEEYNLNVVCYGNLKPVLKVLHNRVPRRTFLNLKHRK